MESHTNQSLLKIIYLKPPIVSSKRNIVNLFRTRFLDQKSNSGAAMEGDSQSYTSPCRPVTHLLSHPVMGWSQKFRSPLTHFVEHCKLTLSLRPWEIVSRLLRRTKNQETSKRASQTFNWSEKLKKKTFLQKPVTEKLKSWLAIPFQETRKMVLYLYTAHIPIRFMAVYNSFQGRGWDRTSACKGAAGSRYQSIVDLTHPTHAYIKGEQKARPQYRELRALLHKICRNDLRAFALKN